MEIDSSLTAGVWGLSAQFAIRIHLIRPNDELPYSIYTDASKFAIGALLVQTDENGETLGLFNKYRTFGRQKYNYLFWRL